MCDACDDLTRLGDDGPPIHADLVRVNKEKRLPFLFRSAPKSYGTSALYPSPDGFPSVRMVK